MHNLATGSVREIAKHYDNFASTDWRAGTLNLADHFTKHHPAAHHKSVRGEFLTPQRVLDEARQRFARTQAPGQTL